MTDEMLVGERAVLEDYLRHYRRALELKCEGLDPEQLARRSVPPSTLSLLGLVRHLAWVEHSWFRRVADPPPPGARLPMPLTGHAEDGALVVRRTY